MLALEGAFPQTSAGGWHRAPAMGGRECETLMRRWGCSAQGYRDPLKDVFPKDGQFPRPSKALHEGLNYI